MFGAIKDRWKKAEAAAVIQHVFEHMKNSGTYGYGEVTPYELSGIVLEAAWRANPSKLNGTYGKRPHKMSIAAYALAHALQNAGAVTRKSVVLYLALMLLINDIRKNARIMDFNNVDEVLLEEATLVMETRGPEHDEFIQRAARGLV